MSKTNYYFNWGLAILFLILAFTVIDYLFHTLRPEWRVPEYYFRNKVIFGFLWSIPILFLAFKFSKLWQRSLFYSGVLVVILQARYYWEGYPLDFVFTFLLIHFLILLLLSLLLFKLTKYNKKFNKILKI